MALAQGEWLNAHENLIITGQTGTGKSWLAFAIGRQAASLDHSALYVRAPLLFEDLEKCGKHCFDTCATAHIVKGRSSVPV
jgi:DNA replication protein DnaC